DVTLYEKLVTASEFRPVNFRDILSRTASAQFFCNEGRVGRGVEVYAGLQVGHACRQFGHFVRIEVDKTAASEGAEVPRPKSAFETPRGDHFCFKPVGSATLRRVYLAGGVMATQGILAYSVGFLRSLKSSALPVNPFLKSQLRFLGLLKTVITLTQEELVVASFWPSLQTYAVGEGQTSNPRTKFSSAKFSLPAWHNMIPSNHCNHILDLVFTNIPEKVSSIKELPTEFDTDHTILEFGIHCRLQPKRGLSRKVFNYRRADWDSLRAHLVSRQLTEAVEQYQDIDSAWEFFFFSQPVRALAEGERFNYASMD
ncbi:hypothetical protein Bbelb_101550, partial [Branchiostoma belcheri]